MKNRFLRYTSALLISLLTLNTFIVGAYELPNSITIPPTINMTEPTTIPTITITTEDRISSIELNEEKIQLCKGDTRYLTATVIYENNTVLPNELYTWSSKNPNIATVDQNGVVTGISKGKTYITVTSLISNVTARCKIVVNKTKYIAFTFDDGPGIYTDKLLDALEKHDAKASFFVLGNRLKKYSKTLKRAYDLNMEIGSHSYSHPNLNKSTKNQIKSELKNTKSLVKKITDSKPSLFRPPYGEYNDTVAKYCDAPMIYWSVDFEDWANRDKQYVYKQILKTAKDGEIVLLHDIHKTTVDGFIKALPKLKKKGYELVTVSELYQIKDKELKDGKIHYGPKHDGKRKKKKDK